MDMWDAVSARGSEVRFSSGEVLLHHGEVSRHCYAIRAGEVVVTVTSSQGATLVLATRGPGAVIGEIGALDGSPRTATVRARTDVVAVVLTAAQFEQLLLDEPGLALAELRRLATRFRDLTERFSMRTEELEARLVHVLRTNAQLTGDPVFRSTREELAGWVGASREAVTRALRQLEAEGAVTLTRGAVGLV